MLWSQSVVEAPFDESWTIIEDPTKKPEGRRLIEELCETIFFLHFLKEAGIDLPERPSTDNGLSRMTGCDESSLDSLISDTVGKPAGIANQDDTVIERIVVLQIDIASA